ncbi:HNH endonuclease [Candidatus Dojkabacteria bacterium]|nr:HNH endonuclease [Candidatus Dojkabacteria bacterium]
MTNKEKVYLINDADFINLVSKCDSKIKVHKALGIPYNGSFVSIVNDRIKKTNAILDIRCLKYEKIKKICPICGNEFNTLKGHRDEKKVCSIGCSNTLFRSGENNGNWKESVYRTTCFLHHKKECVCCGESLIVAVHHLDNNKDNNSPDNLVPLCPTHHTYWHSSYRHIIQDKVLEYIDNFKQSIAELV